MTPGDRPGIPLEAEPVLWLDPGRVGTAAPGDVQPVQRVPALEEEPALWPRVRASGRPPSGQKASSREAPTRTAARPSSPAGPAPVLPATGMPGGWPAGAWLAALGWVLRRRSPDRRSA